MAFPTNLKYLRKKYGYSQDYIAEKLGYKSFTTIQKWESGIAEPSVAKLKILAEMFGVNMDQLLNSDLTCSLKETGDPVGGNEPVITKKDQRDISEILAQTESILQNQEGLMFDGEPASPEAIESIIAAMRFGMSQAAVINKKYTPKKYRKEGDGDEGKENR